MEKWNKLKIVPETYLKRIEFGALKGKSDINPQWRIKAMTEVYGECGIGWYHELKDRQIVPSANNEVLIFCDVAVYTKTDDGWSKPVFGSGGNKLVSKNKNGLSNNDEAFKMAYTDALGTALKSLGVASEIYEGNFDGSKYLQSTDATPKPLPEPTEQQMEACIEWAVTNGFDPQKAIINLSSKYTVHPDDEAYICAEIQRRTAEENNS